jgi:hypothetical protein
VGEVVRALVGEYPEDWERRLPFAEMILRTTPMQVLGGRSPYEVVTGLRPTFPSMLNARQNVRELTVDEYSKEILEYFRATYREVERVQESLQEKRELTVKGQLSAELKVGDVVLVRKGADEKAAGPARFQAKTFPELCRVKRKINVHTFVVEDLADPEAALPFSGMQNADRLIKVELPVLDVDGAQPRTLETLEDDGETWKRWRVESFAVDGRVKLVSIPEVSGGYSRWVDLSSVRYRWVR